MSIQRNVLQLGVVPKEPAAPVVDPDMVAMLEQLLQDAKAGQIATIGFAALYQDAEETIRTGYARSSGSVFSMLGAIERLKLRFYKNWCTTDDE